MEGTTHTLGRDRRRARRLATLIAAAGLLIPGALHSPARAATTAIAGQASASGFPAGASIFHSATIGNAVNPSGTITFRLYSPSDPGCAAAPISTSQVGVSGNGYYTSASYVAPSAGTYRWTATYSGDPTNTPAGPTPCDAASAAVSVAKRTPTFSGTASLAAASGPTAVTATLSGGGPSGPTGRLTYSLYGPSNSQCAGSPAYTTVRNVAGNGAYASPWYTPPSPGDYQWVVVYSGDANNHAAGTSCVDAANAVSISGGSQTGTNGAATLTLSSTSVPHGSPVTVSWAGIAQPTTTDWVAFYAVGAADSNTRTWRYTTGAASGSLSLAVPWGSSPGNYEIRLFANNSTVRLATAPLTVY